jgi:hypothetical protein
MTTLRSIVIALASLTAVGCGDGGDHGSTARVPTVAELLGTYDRLRA